MEHDSTPLRRLRRRSVRVLLLTGIAILAVSLGLAHVQGLRIRDSIRDTELRTAETMFQGAVTEVRAALVAERDLAAQVPSRTQIRVALAEYLDGERTSESYAAFTSPKLQDAVNAAPSMLAVVRLDPELNTVARAGMDIAFGGDAFACAESSMEQDTVHLALVTCVDGEAVLLVSAPIVGEDERRLGTDLVALDPRRVAATLEVAAGRIDGSRAELTYRGGASPVGLSAGAADPADPAHEFQHALLSDWELTWTIPESEIFGESARVVTTINIASVVGAVIVAIMTAAGILTLGRERQKVLVEMDGELRRRTSEVQSLADQRQLLLRESHHRIKNELAVVESLLSLAQRGGDERGAEAQMDAARRRIGVVKSMYEQLVDAEDTSLVRIDRLLSDVIASAPDELSFDVLELEAISLERKTAVPIGIIVNELLLDSYKHAGSASTLHVSLQVRRQAEAIVVRYSDSGDGYPEDVLNGSLGFGLTISRALAEQLQGELVFTNEPGATATLRLTAPAHGVAEHV